MADTTANEDAMSEEVTTPEKDDGETEEYPAESGSKLQQKRAEELEALRSRSVEESADENKPGEVDDEDDKGSNGEQEAGEQTDDSAATATAATSRPSKASVVSVMRAALDSSAQQQKPTSSTPGTSVKRWKRPAGAKPGEGTAAGGGVVLDLESFYKAQRAKNVGEKKKKGEAAKLLHGYRGVAGGDTVSSSLAGESAMSKYQSMLNRRKKEMLPRQVRRGDSAGKLAAANRAAAASYFATSKMESPGSAPVTASPAGATSFESKEGSLQVTSGAKVAPTTTNAPFSDVEELAAQPSKDFEQLKEGESETTPVVETPAPVPGAVAETAEETRVPPTLVAHKGETTASFMKADYRSFVFAVHPEHGLMLLNSTKKKKKGPHFQLPGGHVDDDEFQSAEGMTDGDPASQLMTAGKMAAARELFEETGIDVRAQLDRLQPASLRASDTEEELECEHNKRLYYFMSVEDADFQKDASEGEEIPDTNEGEKLVKSSGEHGADLMLKLSDEHSGFTFESEPAVSAELLRVHSDGCGSEALQMAMNGEVVAEDQEENVSENGAAVSATGQNVGKVGSDYEAAESPKETPEDTEESQPVADDSAAEPTVGVNEVISESNRMSETNAGEKAVEKEATGANFGSHEIAEETAKDEEDNAISEILANKGRQKEHPRERHRLDEEEVGGNSEGFDLKQSIRNASSKGKATPVGAAEQSMVTCRIHGSDVAKKIAKKPNPRVTVGDTLESPDLLARPKIKVGSQLMSCNPFFCCGVDDD